MDYDTLMDPEAIARQTLADVGEHGIVKVQVGETDGGQFSAVVMLVNSTPFGSSGIGQGANYADTETEAIHRATLEAVVNRRVSQRMRVEQPRPRRKPKPPTNTYRLEDIAAVVEEDGLDAAARKFGIPPKLIEGMTAKWL